MNYFKFEFLFFKKLILITLLFLSFCPSLVKAQLNSYILNDSIRARKDIIDVFVGEKRDRILASEDYQEGKLFFSLMPLASSSAGSGIAISTVSTSFYLGNPQTTYLSNITFYPSTNFKSYLRFKVIPNLWLSQNKWNIPGKMELAQTKEDSYGLGGNTSKDSVFVIDYKTKRVYLSLNKSLVHHLFIGLGYNLDYYHEIKDLSDTLYSSGYEKYDKGSGTKVISSGITFNLLRDNRKNSINALGGFYTNLQFRFNTPWLGSTHKWQSLYFDARKYLSFSHNRHRTLALWGLYWATWGDVPYLNLPGTGLDYNNWTGRGYWKARYRGKQMLYAEAEYRFDITKSGLWGAVLFTNFQSFTEPENNRFKYIVPSVGTGLRLKFNKFSDSNITFDFAVGKESYNWYFSLNEVF